MTEETVYSTFIGTANHGFGQHAQEEIRRLFEAGTRFSHLVPSEIFLFMVPAGRQEATQRLLDREPMFLRHMQPVDAELEWDGTVEALGGFAAQKRELELQAGTKFAVQVRKTEQVGSGIAAGACKQAIDEALAGRYEAIPVVKDADVILSVFLTEDTAYVGVSKPEQNLSDWSGGAIRFRKEEGQVSRAKFKLLEAERTFGLDYSQYRSALDIGAAPGGWTSLLLERGVKVTAVDPAKLDASLLRHPQLTFLQKNAAEVRFKEQSFDLLVCDMSWSPRQMGKLIKGLLYSLQSGGTAIITLKLMHKKPFQTVRELTGDLAPELALQKAKQLFHNREELTLFFIKS
ncbi:methyltransferase domain-containing protein [Paenibacillus doosanensis]|uniref:Ribosomal RNA large subunit methyltransferase M n=1 Tax=Paenibacillus konkukensis TaxID=2020716 RepID=A0ABY4RHZ8_9BACL|nr:MULTISPECIES: SAM-dependent methyltransferase [Paenibacillus]MCS7461137.1 methyltransferase domain-containing protein [Paenibacillus doosanensis]UQZ81635.1 Ribosomal RNA large subunit methyltransferase M [Paenibacillus konkukensis]